MRQMADGSQNLFVIWQYQSQFQLQVKI